MIDETKMALRGAKAANVIVSLSELYKLTIQKATELYYKSITADMIEKGIADLNCRSDKYLATLIWDEYQ